MNIPPAKSPNQPFGGIDYWPVKRYAFFAVGMIAIGIGLALRLMAITLDLFGDAMESMSEWCRSKLEQEEIEHGGN